eukprot:Cvel_21710.t1-p1 / transcript=Cvel_21710.t1 / gene=Cvel_21710 / organism=Chromera_velia_CCMP2878 / gene_product=hypothetical protein / transcript_product=hypothetical protein / location=Cvel_scaffold2060:150-1661(-) / protein_length=140 / sequence_SO=supercontig / SO=protein_coding / is_pseudo=false
MLLTTAETDQKDLGIPVFDLEPFLHDPNGCKEACAAMAKEFETKGVVIVKDPRDKDVRAEVFFQVGRTPKHTEKARDHGERLTSYPKGQQPLTGSPPEADPKERWFHPIGERAASGESKYMALNADAVIPEKFGQKWKDG